MRDKRIIYMGTTAFSAHILEQLLDNKYNVVALISQPDRKVGRKQVVKATPTKEVAIKYDADYYGFENINDNLNVIKELKPDIIITCAYGQKINLDILNLPEYGSINVHASLLPKYRGGAPIHYAIINGEKETGNSIMYMEEGLDTGAVLSQSIIEIAKDDTTSSLSDKLMLDGAKLLLETLPRIFSNNIDALEQDEDKVSYSHNIERWFELINFNRSVEEVYNHMRGLINVPGCYAYLNDKKIKFCRVSFEKLKHDDSIGLIKVDNKDYFKIFCLDGYIVVYDFQLEGKKMIAFKDYLNGNKLEIVDNIVLNKGVDYENRSK